MRGVWTCENHRVGAQIENTLGHPKEAKSPKRDVGIPPKQAKTPNWEVFSIGRGKSQLLNAFQMVQWSLVITYSLGVKENGSLYRTVGAF